MPVQDVLCLPRSEVADQDVSGEAVRQGEEGAGLFEKCEPTRLRIDLALPT